MPPDAPPNDGDGDGFQIASMRRKKKTKRHRTTKSCFDRNIKRYSSAFGTKSWSKPASSDTVPNQRNKKSDISTSSSIWQDHEFRPCVDQATECIADDVISSQVLDKALTSAIDSTAAATMVSKDVNVLAEESRRERLSGSEENGWDGGAKNLKAQRGNANPQGQHQLTLQPLSSLLEDYGEEDPNWDAQLNFTNNVSSLPPDENFGLLEDDSGTAADATSPSRLGQHGRAPIHVEFCSFGYEAHGAPAELNREGRSHARPLPLFDARRGDLPTVPHYLAWQDGLSGAVKRALLQPRQQRQDCSEHKKSPMGDFAADMAERVASALVEAIDEGGHGFVLPLRMTVFVG